MLASSAPIAARNTARSRCSSAHRLRISRSCNQCLCLPYRLLTILEELSTMPPNGNSENEAKLLLQNPSKQVRASLRTPNFEPGRTFFSVSVSRYAVCIRPQHCPFVWRVGPIPLCLNGPAGMKQTSWRIVISCFCQLISSHRKTWSAAYSLTSSLRRRPAKPAIARKGISSGTSSSAVAKSCLNFAGSENFRNGVRHFGPINVLERV